MMESDELKKYEKKNIKILDEIKKELGKLPSVQKCKGKDGWDSIY